MSAQSQLAFPQRARPRCLLSLSHEAEVSAPLEAKESMVEAKEAAWDSTPQAQDTESAAVGQVKLTKAQG